MSSTDILSLPEELTYLIAAFLPSQPSETRSKAYLVLSAFCQGVRNRNAADSTADDANTESLKQVFAPLISSHLTSDEEVSILTGISLFTALFQVDWQSAAAIFQLDDFAEFIMDTVDLTPSSELALAVAQLISQASGHKSCRPVVATHAITWLENYSNPAQADAVRAAAAIALIKLSKGTAADDAASTDPTPSSNIIQDEDLAEMMKGLVINRNNSIPADAIEALAYLSVDPNIKESLSKDQPFLKQLFALVPSRRNKSTADTTSLVYGVIVIIANMCAYKPKLTEEQAQIEKLRTMAKAQQTSTDSALNDDTQVRARNSRLVAAGVLDVLASAVPGTDSENIRINAGTSLLHIIEDKVHRGKVLQAGGAKALLIIIRDATKDVKKVDMLNAIYLPSIQALAKLSITAPPIHVFGPDDNALFNAIRPLSVMLQHSSSSLLQRFEALMAFTNFASKSPEAAEHVAMAEGLMNKVEMLMLEEHTLVRRAAVELICNLVAGSDEIFERYSMSRVEHSSSNGGKLQVLVALSDVEDLATRLAASGALATLTSASSACRVLVKMQVERHRMFPIIARLIDPSIPIHDEENEDEEIEEYHPGLAHRGIICARNVLIQVEKEESIEAQRSICVEAAKSGLMDALIGVAKKLQDSGDAADSNMLNPVGEVLSFLVRARPVDNESTSN